MEQGQVVIALEGLGKLEGGQVYRVAGAIKGNNGEVKDVRLAGERSWWPVGLFRALSDEEVEQVKEAARKLLEVNVLVPKKVERALGKIELLVSGVDWEEVPEIMGPSELPRLGMAEEMAG